jgi:hypothetical protein
MNQDKLDLQAIHYELMDQSKLIAKQNRMIDEGIDMIALLLITFLVCWLVKTAHSLYHNWSDHI